MLFLSYKVSRYHNTLIEQPLVFNVYCNSNLTKVSICNNFLLLTVFMNLVMICNINSCAGHLFVVSYCVRIVKL